MGTHCPVCGKKCNYNEIPPYYRYAIDTNPFKKEKVPIARFRCKIVGLTFSVLPHQLIPYCQYTVNAIIQTLLEVYNFQERGQKGYYGVCLQMDPDCSATPFLILTWAKLLATGLKRGHHILHRLFPGKLPEDNNIFSIIKKIYLYIKGICSPEPPGRFGVSQAMIHFFKNTNNHLFGLSSSDRNRSP
ncbi:DUF6431 domain-containing protein [Desulfobacula sp.]|uniref:DUF6431 domain-containing protein n=1 Tax=Desulfobacula sp. TaxID=2593537 RepID=UPI0039B845B5